MYDYKMKLTSEQIDILSGKWGSALAKMMELLVKYGDSVGAKELIPISNRNDKVLSNYILFENKQIISALNKLDCDINKLKDLYKKKNNLEKLLLNVGFKNLNSSHYRESNQYSDINYGDILTWTDKYSVIYANSVLGARVNRNNPLIVLYSSVLGYVPKYGYTTIEGRRANCKIVVNTFRKPDPQVLGAIISKKINNEVPYIFGLENYLGTELTNDVKTYLQELGSSIVKESNIDLFHVDNLTKGAVEYGESLIEINAKEYTIDDADLDEMYKSYAIDKNVEPNFCLMGCPFLSYDHLIEVTHKLTDLLKDSPKHVVKYKTLISASVDTINKFKNTKEYKDLTAAKVIITSDYLLTYIKKKSFIATSSSRLVSSLDARYYKEEDLLKLIAGK